MLMQTDLLPTKVVFWGENGLGYVYALPFGSRMAGNSQEREHLEVKEQRLQRGEDGDRFRDGPSHPARPQRLRPRKWYVSFCQRGVVDRCCLFVLAFKK